MSKDKYAGPERRSRNGWHLDKRVPLVLVFTIVVQTAGIVWWAATLQARVDNQGEAIAGLSQVPSRLAVLESLMLRVERAVARQQPGPL